MSKPAFTAKTDEAKDCAERLLVRVDKACKSGLDTWPYEHSRLAGDPEIPDIEPGYDAELDMRSADAINELLAHSAELERTLSRFERAVTFLDDELSRLITGVPLPATGTIAATPEYITLLRSKLRIDTAAVAQAVAREAGK